MKLIDWSDIPLFRWNQITLRPNSYQAKRFREWLKANPISKENVVIELPSK